jgi:uncharacterized protein (TIGR02099 family)
LLRSLWYGSALVLTLLALVFSVARLWLLPALAEKNQEIAAYLSEQSGYPVQIERLESYWDGLNPGLRAFDFAVVVAARERPVVQLKELRLSLSWLPLLIGRVEINSLVLVRPSLAFERLADGRFAISGLDPVAADSEQDREGFVQWLFAQKALAVEDGELLWRDHLSADPALRLSGVNLNLRNAGQRHRLGMTAEFPEAFCRSCAFVADVSGNPLAGEPWSGQIYLRALGLDPAALPDVLRRLLPDELKGRFDAQLWSEWENGEPRAIQGEAGVAGLNLPLPGLRRALRVNEARTEVHWKGAPSMWRLELKNLRLGLTGRPWSAGRLRIEHDPAESTVRIGHLDLGDVGAFIADLPGENRAREWLSALRPSGGLNGVKLHISHDDPDHPRYALELDARDIQVEPHRFVPGVSGVSGHLVLTQEQGEFELDAGSGSLTLPQMFRETLAWRKASGRVSWRRTAEYWQLQAEDLRLSAEDGKVKGALELRLPHAAGESPYLDLRAELRDGNGAHAARYYPSSAPPDLRAWLEASVLSGEVTHGHLILSGAISDFPFRNDNGQFEVAAHVRNGLFEYLPGWPRIEQVEADLLLRGAELVITARDGRIGRLAVGQVVARIEDLEQKNDQRVYVSGRVEGEIQEALEVLSQSPSLPKGSALFVSGMRGDGRGRLALDLVIPLEAKRPFALAGEYRFRQAALHLPFAGISLEHLEGGVDFDADGLTAVGLHGRMLGGEFRLQADSAEPAIRSELKLAAQGRFTGEGLARALGPAFAPYLEGEAEWRARLRLHDGIPDFQFESDLQRFGMHLPAPLDKARAAPAKLTLKTVAADPDHHVLDLHLDKRVAGKFAFRRGPRGWEFSKGRLGVGWERVALPEEAGLQLDLRAPRLDGDQWLRLLRAAPGGGDSAWAQPLIRLSAEIGMLKLLDVSFGQFQLTLGRWPSGWRGQVRSEILGGDILIRPGAPHAVYLDLDHLSLPDTLWEGEATSIEIDPRALPELHVKSENLKVSGRSLGGFDLKLLPNAQGLRIEQLRLTRPETTLQAQGQWRVTEPGKASTQIEVNLSSSDLGMTLEALGFPDELAGGRAELHSTWSWNGTPLEFNAARLDGSLTVALTNGRLLQIQQGAGRLFGIFNLRSLVRYLVLDFSTIFGKGFVFDSIRGGITVNKGSAYTGGLAIKGPSAAILIIGRVGLAARDFELEVSVLPRLKELVVTGWLFSNPAVSGAVVALQELFKKPFTETIRVRYLVKGPWSDPQVTQPGRREGVETAPLESPS